MDICGSTRFASWEGRDEHNNSKPRISKRVVAPRPGDETDTERTRTPPSLEGRGVRVQEEQTLILLLETEIDPDETIESAVVHFPSLVPVTIDMEDQVMTGYVVTSLDEEGERIAQCIPPN